MLVHVELLNAEENHARRVLIVERIEAALRMLDLGQADPNVGPVGDAPVPAEARVSLLPEPRAA